MNQFNSIVMALAGASRIFTMMDEEPEQDDGYVTLVKVHIQEDGSMIETNDDSGTWAWRHPHHDGSVEFIELKGKIDFEDVTFGYTPDKIVLHDISLYAKPKTRSKNCFRWCNRSRKNNHYQSIKSFL